MGYRLNGHWQKMSSTKKVSSIILGAVGSALTGLVASSYEKMPENILIALMILGAGGGGELYVLLVNRFTANAVQRFKKITGGQKNDRS